jgi:carboxyl-terminal processing protease
VREADLRRHLINEVSLDKEVIEDDGKPDPRFSATADDLKKKGVDDFQLLYAVQTLSRLAKAPGSTSTTASAGGGGGTRGKR